MFNPKGGNILDEQLAVSGLELGIVITPALALAGVSFATNVVGGIMGMSATNKANKQNQANYRGQQKAAKKVADRTNEYNKAVFATDLQNYYNNREYEWETTLRNYQYNQSVQDFQYTAAMAQYAASVENTEQQLVYNSLAAQEAQESEQAALNEILTEDAFQREGLLIEQMKTEGRSALLQAGRSKAKAMQSNVAAAGRDLAVMSASVEAARAQSGRNMRDIALGKFIDDQNVMSAMMIKPQRMPDYPEPIQAPERIFIEPMKVDPAFISAPIKQNPYVPLVQSVGGGLQTFAQPGLYQ